MKKLMYVLTLCFISGFMFSCADELVSPDEAENVEVPSAKSGSEGGGADKDNGVKR